MFAVPALLLGCTSLLGIDGSYVQGEFDGAPSSGGTVGRDSGGAAGNPGGSSGSGGVLSAGGGGLREPEAGPAPLDSGPQPQCGAGHYSGAFDGSHRPLVTFVGVPVTVGAGTIAFDLTGPGTTLTVTGELHSKLISIVPDAGTLSATLTGRFDCTTRAIVDGRLSGTLSIVNLIPTSFEGQWSGGLSKDGTFSGTWTEAETNRPPAGQDGGTQGPCVPSAPGASQPIGKGCGTWRAN